MADTPKAVPAKKIVRKRAGYRRIMVTLSEERAKVLDELAAADMRQGGATEMATVLFARNFDALVKTAQPAQMFLLEPRPTITAVAGKSSPHISIEEVAREVSGE